MFAYESQIARKPERQLKSCIETFDFISFAQKEKCNSTSINAYRTWKSGMTKKIFQLDLKIAFSCKETAKLITFFLFDHYATAITRLPRPALASVLSFSW